jgi:sulfur transfer protein SufE
MLKFRLMPAVMATPRIFKGLSAIFSRTLKGKTADKMLYCTLAAFALGFGAFFG